MEIGHVADVNGQIIRRLGTRLAGKWCLVRLLGLGGTAAVYEARHATGRRVAVKMLHARHKGKARLHKRFVREAYVANSLSHPAVVPVYDVDVHDDGTPYLIMDLLTGQSVEVFRRRQGGRLAPERVREIAEVVLEVLIEAHSKGVVHRDLKPANLFLTKQGALKVLDFGIAKCPQVGPVSAGATRFGSLLGTPAFMSPEQARGQWDAVDHQSDLWSLGATLFTLLTGRAVHDAANVNQQWALAMGAPTTKVRDALPEVPEQLAAAVDGALRLAKNERWPDAAHMYRALTGREAPALPSAEEPTHDDFSTLSRTLSLKETVSGQVGRRRQLLALGTAGLIVLGTATASQRNASSRSDAGRPQVVAAPEEKHTRAEVGPAVRPPTDSTLAAAPAAGDSTRRGKAPPAMPARESMPQRARAAKAEWSRAQATRPPPAMPKRKAVALDGPTAVEPEFGALLDVWE